MDNYYKQHNDTKSYEEIQDIDEMDDTDEQQELEDFIADVNDAWFDIDEEEALKYISAWKSSED